MCGGFVLYDPRSSASRFAKVRNHLIQRTSSGTIGSHSIAAQSRHDKIARVAIRFTKHAREKFEILARHGVSVTEAQVIETLTAPDRLEKDQQPAVAQKALDDQHVLRVVFRSEGDDMIVVTFYPGRRQRYEN